MSDYASHRRKHLRISILRLILADQGWKSNESLLHGYLPGLGIPVSRDQVRGELAWLRDQGLVATEETHGFMVAELTPQGVDVAKGHITHPDVQRPSRTSL